MPTSSAPNPLNASAATLRQLKVLVLVLVLSNIGLGAFGFYVLHTVDRRYSDLINQSVPALNDLQELTVRSVAAVRATNPLVVNRSANGRDEAIRRGRSALERERELRLKLIASGWLASADASRQECEQSGDDFTAAATEVLRLHAAGDTAGAARRREESLLPAFDRYISAINQTADALQAESLRTNRDVSARTSTMSRVILGVASWPVIVLLTLLILTALFVIVLMILFRGREMSDMP